jgi:signal transduction histidine kinase
MKKTHSLLYHITLFVLAQIAWFSLLGLWIYWYVTNHLLLSKVGQELPAKVITDVNNVPSLVIGLVLLIIVSISMSLIFIYLNRQLSLTKTYDNFISNITHELKSPLSSIQLYLETIKTRNPEQKQRDKFVSIMLKDVERLNTLINSVLYISGLERKKTIPKYSHDYHIYDANKALREMVLSAANQHNIDASIITFLGAANCRCVIDKNWFQIAINNIVDNARKYTKDDLKLSVKLSCSAKTISLSIRDNGIGIIFRDQKRIFQKFSRIYSKENPSVKGTGLGLYWAKEIIKYHGGNIFVYSKGKMQGTTFKIELPVYKAAKKRYIRNLIKKSAKG